MSKTSLFSILLALAACGPTEVDADLEPWLEQARTSFDKTMQQLAARWGEPLRPSWGSDPASGETVFFDFDHAKIYWLKNKKSVLVADAQFVGSYQADPKAPADKPEEAGSWRWSWDNENVPAVAKKRIEAVRRWGEARRSVKFTRGAWIGRFPWAMDMMAASMRILGTTGAYFKQFGQTGYFFVLEEIRKPAADELEPDLSKATPTDK